MHAPASVCVARALHTSTSGGGAATGLEFSRREKQPWRGRNDKFESVNYREHRGNFDRTSEQSTFAEGKCVWVCARARPVEFYLFLGGDFRFSSSCTIQLVALHPAKEEIPTETLCFEKAIVCRV